MRAEFVSCAKPQIFALFKYFVIADLQTILHSQFFGMFIISYTQYLNLKYYSWAFFCCFIMHSVSHMKRFNNNIGMLCNMNSTLLDYVTPPPPQTHMGIYFFNPVPLPYCL